MSEVRQRTPGTQVSFWRGGGVRTKHGTLVRFVSGVDDVTVWSLETNARRATNGLTFVVIDNVSGTVIHATNYSQPR